MKKIIVLAVLILALSASMVGAVSWTTTLITNTPATLTLKADANFNIGTSLWEYRYELTNSAYVGTIDKFNVTMSKLIPKSSLVNLFAPLGWSVKTITNAEGTAFQSWIDSPGGIAPSSFGDFGFDCKYAPGNGIADAINGKSFNGDTLVPVPEASTLVGFGSALVMAGPGMIGWLRRRRA